MTELTMTCTVHVQYHKKYRDSTANHQRREERNTKVYEFEYNSFNSPQLCNEARMKVEAQPSRRSTASRNPTAACFLPLVRFYYTQHSHARCSMDDVLVTRHGHARRVDDVDKDVPAWLPRLSHANSTKPLTATVTTVLVINAMICVLDPQWTERLVCVCV